MWHTLTSYVACQGRIDAVGSLGVVDGREAMSDLLDRIAAQLEDYSREEVIALVRDFLAELGEDHQRRFLLLVQKGPRPLLAESMGLSEAEDLLDAIQELHDAIESDEYVEYGAGYDAEYGEYRGFGDDSWIEEMDNLFAAATSLYRAGQWKAAADAYIALFHIFDLNEDGFHFTRPDPAAALRTDLDTVKEQLFIALARSDPDPVATAIEQSDDLHRYGKNRYALLDAWQSREDLMDTLHSELIDRTRQPATYWTSHAADLLREFYRRYRALADYEWLGREVGAQQGWPYEELVTRYRDQSNWEQVLAWSDDGLLNLAAESHYRRILQEARGEALLQLNRPAEALETLLTLFGQQRSAPVYLKLRDAARAAGRWETLWPRIEEELRTYVLSQAEGTHYPGGMVSYSAGIFPVAGLLGYAHLLEGAWQNAVAWAADRQVPAGWGDDDLPRIVATGLLRMALVARGTGLDDVLTEELSSAPKIIRDFGALLEPVARSLPVDPLLNGAVQLYERLVERAIAGKSRPHYAQAGAICKVIRSIRRLQSRGTDFEGYYHGLLDTYTRFSALKDELRTAIEGADYKRKR